MILSGQDWKINNLSSKKDIWIWKFDAAAYRETRKHSTGLECAPVNVDRDEPAVEAGPKVQQQMRALDAQQFLAQALHYCDAERQQEASVPKGEEPDDEGLI